VRRTPIGGGDSTVVATDQGMPGAIVVDGRYVYWLNSQADGAVMRIAKYRSRRRCGD
jgi:hypothetical protein